MRLLLTGLAAALVIVLLPPVAANASTGASTTGLFDEVIENHYHTATSTSDTSPRKSVTVTCPAGQIVYGFGGSTVDSDGQVALTGIVPNEELTAVTAIAQVRNTRWNGTWSVVAAATCWPPGDLALQRVFELGSGASMSASCPGNKLLYSSGYLVESAGGSPYVDAVIPAPDLSSVLVRGGGASGLHVSAIALCGKKIDGPCFKFRERTEQTVPVGTGSTTTATAPLPLIQGCGTAWVFGAGVSSTRPGMFIDALGPGPHLAGGLARMARADILAKGMVGAADEDEVTTYGTCIGSWY